MPYEIDPDEMEAAINMAMLSPIPVVPKRSATDFLSASSSALAAASPHAIASPGWFTADQERQLLTTIGSDKVLITDVQRTEMSRLVYMIIRSTNLPESFQNTTTSPQLILISRAIENKLFERAESHQSYLDLSTLAFRLSALACPNIHRRIQGWTE
ncbi:hypothetical protein ACHAWO_011239 [Cyclotella atomus]|uniref:Uncharacterized protein n=1 Tax=Cyclotella atomus TaxID=382360 RepID=A0ABD3PAB7_9STRA